MPLVEGLDGVNKMSKSLGNYIGINESPEQIFGKLMSISDDLMWRYLELLSFQAMSTLRQWKIDVDAGKNPRDVKVALAQEIVARFHSQAAAEQVLADFEARFKQNAIPDNLPESLIPCGSSGMGIAQLLKQAGLTPSTSESLRMIDQGGVKIDGVKVSDRSLVLPVGTDAVFQVGKRKFARVRLT